MLYKRLRQLLRPLSHTPFHPQWLLTNQKSVARKTVRQWARGNILDIGCGDRWLSEAIVEGNYIGLDYPATVAQGYPGRPDVFGDAARLPFMDTMADTVLLMDVLEHLRSPEVAISEAVRILKPAGYLILQVPFIYPIHDAPNDFHRWTHEGLHLLLQQHSLKVIEQTDYGNPVETWAVLGAIALVKSGLNSFSQRRVAMLLIPVVAVLVPLVNTLGWLLGKAFPADPFMPLGYRLVAQKIA